MLCVSGPTDVTVNRIDVTVRAGNSTDVPPEFAKLPVSTTDPSENDNRPPVTHSHELGRSNNTTRSTRTGCAHTNSTQLPTPPPTVAHSLV